MWRLLLETFFEGEAKLLPLDPDRRLLDEWLFAMSSHIISSSKRLNWFIGTRDPLQKACVERDAATRDTGFFYLLKKSSAIWRT
jgi:hypothetical protein